MRLEKKPPFDKRIFIKSSELRWVKYEPKRLVLTAEFRAGGIYEYEGVPEREFIALIAAESRGRYFNANIRDHYPYVQIS
jgi:KTSC domain